MGLPDGLKFEHDPLQTFPRSLRWTEVQRIIIYGHGRGNLHRPLTVCGKLRNQHIFELHYRKNLRLKLTLLEHCTCVNTGQ